MDELRYLSEYLARIKSVAISIQLPESYDIINLSFEDTLHAIVRYRGSDHNEKEGRLFLPEEISYSVTQSVQQIAESTNTISFRLPAVPNEKNENKSTFVGSAKVVVPWPAHDLASAEELSIVCSQCDKLLVADTKSGRKKWNQLPSENWAEMMDFWHCHKPENKEEIEAQQHNPGYAISRFVPRGNKAFVGLSYFLFGPQYTNNVTHSTNSLVLCQSCGGVLGLSENSDSLKLWKWNLKVKSNGLTESFPNHLYVSAIISDLIDSHATYTFSLNTEDDSAASEPKLLLWIFNPDVKYTNTNCDGTKKGFKVFYSANKEHIPGLMRMRGDIEPLALPSTVFESFVSHLDYNSNLLPENYRWHGNWRAGIAEKL